MLGNIYAINDMRETDRMNSMFGNGWKLLGLEETYELKKRQISNQKLESCGNLKLIFQ